MTQTTSPSAKTKAPLQIPMPSATPEARERNRNKPPTDPDDNRCRICSNPVVAAQAWLIHETGDGESIWRADLPESVTDKDTYGWQPVGSECARRVPKAYRSKMEEPE